MRYTYNGALETYQIYQTNLKVKSQNLQFSVNVILKHNLSLLYLG